MIWATLKMILALGGVLVLLWGLVRVFKRVPWGGADPGPDAGIRVLTSKPIAPQKYISLVEIGGEVLALGVTSQQITFLAKIENQEMVKKNLSSHHQIRPETLSWLRGVPFLLKREKGAILERGDEK
jgi:flagellar biogenesis protein FliO